MAGGGRPTPPLAALGVLAVLTAIFAAEHVFAIEPGGPRLAPGLKTLLALGAMNSRLVFQDGEWHRLMTAAVLHGDVWHLLFNAVALVAAGTVLERLAGRAWFLILFALGAVAGSLAALLVNPPPVVSVGASGAIMAQLAAAFVLGFRRAPGQDRRRVQATLLAVLAPALLPLADPVLGALGEGLAGQVDYASHLGGALAGAAVGLILLRHPNALGTSGALLAATLAVVMFAGTGLLVARDHHAFRLAVQLIPNDSLPKTDHDAIAQADQLVAQYPRDPRARLMQARARLVRDDLEAAEATLRAGLAEEEILRTMFTRETEWKLRAMLASVRSEQGDRAEARHLARDICLNGGDSPLRLLLTTEGLCEPSPLQ